MANDHTKTGLALADPRTARISEIVQPFNKSVDVVVAESGGFRSSSLSDYDTPTGEYDDDPDYLEMDEADDKIITNNADLAQNVSLNKKRNVISKKRQRAKSKGRCAKLKYISDSSQEAEAESKSDKHLPRFAGFEAFEKPIHAWLLNHGEGVDIDDIPFWQCKYCEYLRTRQSIITYTNSTWC